MSKLSLQSILLVGGLAAGSVLFTGGRLEWPAHSHAAVFQEKATPPAAAAVAVADVRSLSQAFTALADQSMPAVVNVYTTSGGKAPAQRMLNPQFQLPPGFGEELQQFGFPPQFQMQIPQMKREALGSGFVINAEEGYIVTNAHVVRMAGQNADEIMVKFIGEDNDKGHPAKIIGADEVSDVALLKLIDKKPGIKALALGDSSKAKVGEWVLAIGNPYGHTNTVTQGIVSAIGRNLEGLRNDFLQTSAGINPGNSGGPLINMNSEVIGINSAMDPRAQNIGFAIPSNSAKDVIAQLVEKGKVQRAWLGVAIEDINDESAGLMHLKDKDGVLVRQVVANAPASKAGIEVYDVIKKIDGNDIHSSHDLFKTIEKLPAGKTAEVQLLRGNSMRTVPVQLGEMPANT